MGSNRRKSAVRGSKKSGGSIAVGSDREGMGKEERKEMVLRMLDESDLALTPYVLFRNLKMQGATFERRTVSNYLNELVEEGRVEKVTGGGDTLYQITDTGHDSISE